MQDTALAVALTIADLAVTVYYRHQLHPLGIAMLLVAAENLPLVIRRAHPLAAMIVIGGARVAYDVIGLGYAPLPLGPAIAFYTVLNRCKPRTCVISCVIALAAITISETQPGHNQPYDLIVAVLIFIASGMAGILSRTRRAYLEATEARAARAEAERDRESARAAAAERARIARELHDVVAHHVSLMAVQAEAAASLLPGRPAQARQSVDIIGDTARQALTELRRLLGVLRGPAGEIETEPSPSLSELGTVLDQVRAAGLPVEFRTGGQPGSLAPGVELTAYRIVQEALTNALKHAPASQAVVTLAYEPGFVTVTVANSDSGPATAVPGGTERFIKTHEADAAADRADWVEGADGVGGVNGIGGVSRVAGARSGFGLAGIAERVASCGGNLSAGPAPDGGFAITARLPAR